jgi:thioredoxin 1
VLQGCAPPSEGAINTHAINTRFPRMLFSVRMRPALSAATTARLKYIPTHLANKDIPMSEHIHYITDDSFEQEVLQSPLPVLVDYWADWCGPCKMISPILDEVSKDYAGRLKVCKLNIDENPATPPKYAIRGIPTLMLFKNGNVEATKVGALSKSQLAAFVDSNI